MKYLQLKLAEFLSRILPRKMGEHYLVYGSGTMGLLMAQLAPEHEPLTVRTALQFVSGLAPDPS